LGKRKLGFAAGKNEITVMVRADMADALAIRAASDRRTLGACLDLLVESYLSSRELVPLPEGSRLHRHLAGGGETKMRRYRIEPKTVRLLEEAEALGYSQSYVIEEAVKEGLANAGQEGT
jgi:hypothetical protein